MKQLSMGFIKQLPKLVAARILLQASCWIVRVVEKFAYQNGPSVDPIWLRFLEKTRVSFDKDFACVRHVDHMFCSVELLHVEAEEILKDFGCFKFLHFQLIKVELGEIVAKLHLCFYLLFHV